MIKLSILVLTTPRRVNNMFSELMKELDKQIGNKKDIEVLGLYDNKTKSVGEKRNNLVSLAKGQFLCFIDDDDRIDDSYIESIMSAIDQNPSADCICFGCETTVNGADKHFSKYSISYEYERTGDQWRGKPSHTMVWRSAIAKKYSFPVVNYNEDVPWVMKAHKDIKNEIQIDKILYYYIFDSNISETRS